MDYPIIIGNRKKRRDPILRVFLSKIILRVLILLIFHKNIQDAGAPFRLIRADFLKYFLKFEEKDSAHPNVQMAIVANKILSIDVMHFNRKHEQVSWPIIKLLRFGLKLIDDIYLLWKKLKNRN